MTSNEDPLLLSYLAYLQPGEFVEVIVGVGVGVLVFVGVTVGVTVFVGVIVGVGVVCKQLKSLLSKYLILLFNTSSIFEICSHETSLSLLALFIVAITKLLRY